MPLTEKSRNLIHLNEHFPVPKFVILGSGDVPPADLLKSASQFIVRGCIPGEDLPGHTLAGQGLSIGPVTADEVPSAIHEVFQNSNAIECILQVYIGGDSGVLIYTSPGNAVLEYSSQPGGVTGGRISPYVAVFPNSITRYEQLNSLIPKLYDIFGACDIELVNPQTPSFVQVRPYHQTLLFDYELLYAKMMLQELNGDRWVQNEFCMDMLESPGKELGLIKLYCEEIRDIASELDSETEPIAPSDFVKIGQQIFMRDLNLTFRYADYKHIVSAGQWLHREYQRLKTKCTTGQATPNELMRAAIVFRTYSDMLERAPKWLTRKARKEVLKYRQKVREHLVASICNDPLPAYVPLSKRLKNLIEKNSDLKCWTTFEYASESGIVVVPGDFQDGPWVKYTLGDPFPSNKCYLITDELYPEIYPLFPYIKGVICRGGGLNSHLAILAREHRMPLWIQVVDTERFLSK